MDGRSEFLTDLIEGKTTRFVIPVYQRNYDWKPEQCGRLFDDLEDVAREGRKEHFFGSIVSQTPRGERVVIDGQQRITTVFLLLAAMRTQLKEGVVESESEYLADDIECDYLIDRRRRRERKLRLKLVKSDSEAFDAILDERLADFVQGSNVTQNYLYFLDRIARTDIGVDDLYQAVKSLCVIDITLDEHDDAQLIFESLNSTGLDLSEADKIRNFVLMNLDQERQEDYYEAYWNAMEKNTSYRVSDFIRFYLAARTGKTPAIKKVYPAFRAYAKERFPGGDGGAVGIDTEGLLSDLLRYSRHYRTCAYPDTGSEGIDRALAAIYSFDASVTAPYLLNLLEYRASGAVSDQAVERVLRAIDSYLFRRWACSVPANALNKIFETLHTDALKGVADGAPYDDVVCYLLLNKGGTGRFPGDEDFLRALGTRDFYHIQNRKLYLYDRLENGGSRERVDVRRGLEEGVFSIEHIMPQTLSAAWRESLGDDWERIHGEWCHKLANLTLTAYNSDYSNRPFTQKRDMEDGFASSGFRMNRWVAQQGSWGEAQLAEREAMLREQFLRLWPMPETSYVPKRTMPEVAALDADIEFTGRRVAAINFMGSRYAVTQWNDAEVLALRLLCELEPAKIHSLVGGTTYPASAFISHEAHGHATVAEGVFVKTATNTSTKIELLRIVFKMCGMEPSELTFEMQPEQSEREG